MRGLSGFCLSFLFFSLFVVAAEAKAKKAKVYKIKARSSVVIYVHPTAHSAVSTKIPANSRWILRLTGIKKYSSSTWYQVSWNGKKGWVNKTKIIYDSLATAIVAKKPDCLLSKTRSKDCDLSS